MRAAVFHECPGLLQIDEVLLDAPGRREVRVRTMATGLCHSDLHHMQRLSPVPKPTPMVLGHEAAGIIEAIGEDVTYVKPRGPRDHLPDRILRQLQLLPLWARDALHRRGYA